MNYFTYEEFETAALDLIEQIQNKAPKNTRLGKETLTFDYKIGHMSYYEKKTIPDVIEKLFSLSDDQNNYILNADYLNQAKAAFEEKNKIIEILTKLEEIVHKNPLLCNNQLLFSDGANGMKYAKIQHFLKMNSDSANLQTALPTLEAFVNEHDTPLSGECV